MGDAVDPKRKNQMRKDRVVGKAKSIKNDQTNRRIAKIVRLLRHRLLVAMAMAEAALCCKHQMRMAHTNRMAHRRTNRLKKTNSHLVHRRIICPMLHQFFKVKLLRRKGQKKDIEKLKVNINFCV